MAGRSTNYPGDRALQWGDLDRTGQKSMHQIMRDWGSSLPERAADIMGRLQNSSDKNAPKRLAALEPIAEHLKSRPITLRGATDRRVEHFVNGTRRSAAEGVDSGAGWYFAHRHDINQMAAEHDFPEHHAIKAAAAMSPNNSPENEKAALHQVMRESRGLPVDETQLKRGGTNVNIDKARGTLSGDIEDPLNPAPAAPKVRSYRQATIDAVPNSPVHDEYMGRVHHAMDVINGRQMKGQGRLDLWGLQNSTEGILSPTRNTAEDTWMNTITLGQNIDMNVGRRNVAKTAASDKSLGLSIPKVPAGRPRSESAHPAQEVSGDALLHAYNNEATVRAARKVGEMTGVDHFPAVAMQEVAWTEARRRAGKDPEYNQQSQAKAQSDSQQGKLF